VNILCPLPVRQSFCPPIRCAPVLPDIPGVTAQRSFGGLMPSLMSLRAIRSSESLQGSQMFAVSVVQLTTDALSSIPAAAARRRTIDPHRGGLASSGWSGWRSGWSFGRWQRGPSCQICLDNRRAGSLSLDHTLRRRTVNRQPRANPKIASVPGSGTALGSTPVKSKLCSSPPPTKLLA
jgi:hypothetical protein